MNKIRKNSQVFWTNMAVPKKIMHKVSNAKLKLSDLNPHLMCVLCGGYYIDATTIVECLHSFCRSCIVKHLEGSKYCPICEVQVHKTKPLINIRPDKTLQDIVYKLVPGLFASEMQNRRVFYQERPHYIKPDDSESVGDLPDIPLFFINGENITFSLIYLDGPSPVHMEERMQELTNVQNELRYFRCPSGVTIQHLKKLLKAKYELRGNNYRIDIFFRDEALIDEYTLLDISYIYLWKTKDNLSLTYKIYEYPAKRRRRRYFGGVDELPAHYTPLSILQSRLGNSVKSLPKEMTEGRRHLRSDIEKKKREIENKIREDRRELRSHDEKKRLREKERDNKNEGKKKFKNKDKDGKIEKKKDKESKTHDGRRKENRGGDDLKKDPKNHDEKDDEKRKRKRKEKEGKCTDEKRKEKEDREDEDESRKEKDAKDEKNKEIKKEGEKKRKREGDGEEKRKREKREEIKEKVVDKKEEGKEEVDDSNTSREATPATTSEPAPVPTSAPAAEPAQTLTSADEISVSTSAADSTSASISTSDPTLNSTSPSTSGSESALEPTSTTNAENEQKADESAMETEESPTSSEATYTRERRSTPPKNNEIKIVQLQICESGVMRLLPVVNNNKNVVKPPEERVCMRVTRRSSITSATPPQDEAPVVPQKKKRGPKPKNKTGEGASKETTRKAPPKPTKIYKTIRRSPNVWHPSISKEKLRQTLMRDTEEAKKPAKFFKLRNRIRMLESQLNDVKTVKNDTIIEEEEEEVPRREMEKEEAKVEPQQAQAAKRDEVEEGKIDEEEKRQNKDDNKPESGLKEDPKCFGPLDKEDKYSTIVGANAPDLPNNLKGDPNTFGSLDKEDKCSTMVGANAPDLPTNLKDEAKNFGPLDEGDKHSIMGGANTPDLPTNLKGDVKNLGLLDKEDRCTKIIGTSAANLLTNPFIPNSNHFLFSDVTLPPNSGNFSKSAEPKLDISVLGQAVAGISGIGSGAFNNPVTNGANFTPIGFLDPSRLVYSYQTYAAPDTDPVPCTSHLAPFAKVTSFSPVPGFHATLSPTINNLSSPLQNVQVVSLVKNKDDSTNERMKSCVESLNGNNTEEKEQKKKRKRGRRPAETTVTNMLKKDASNGTKMEMDEKEEEEDEEKIFVPAKRKRDEKGSREKDKKEKGKDDKWEKGDKKRGDEGAA